MPKTLENRNNRRAAKRLLSQIASGKSVLTPVKADNEVVKPVARHPITGCRADSLMGIWLIDPAMLERYHNLVSAYDLTAMKEMSAQIEAPAAQVVAATGAVKKIARIAINGPTTKYMTSFQAMVGGTSTLHTRRLLAQAADNPEVGSILLDIDSPGGTWHGAGDLADSLQKTAAKKPVIVFANGMMCSAGMLFGSQGSRIVATPETMVGSIGVKAVLKDTSELHAKMGVKVIPITTGKMKALAEPGTKITDEQIAAIRKEVGEIHNMFLSYVSKGRNKLTAQKLDALEAGVFLADKAKEIGLIDEVGDEERAIALAVEAAANPEAFLSRKTSTAVGASTAAPNTAADSAVRGKRTMLTPEQLAQAQQLPGAKATLTAENADVELLAVASTLAADNKALKAQIPAAVPEALATGYVELAHGRIDLLAAKEKLVPAQATLLKGMVTKDAVQANGNVVLSLDNFMKVMGDNRPAGLLDKDNQEVTSAQKQGRDTPGKTDDDEKPLTKEQKQTLLEENFAGLGAASTNGDN